MLYNQINIFLVMSGCFLGQTSTLKRIKYLAEGYFTVHQVRLEPDTPQSQVKHSTTDSNLFESCFDGNPKDRFCHIKAHIGMSFQ